MRYKTDVGSGSGSWMGGADGWVCGSDGEVMMGG